jgi:6-phosphogluconolactonase
VCIARAGLPVFDVILLGLGPDGHVASLFPNRSQLAPTREWVLPVENSPKPPPERITFSLPVINRCGACGPSCCSLLLWGRIWAGRRGTA